MQITFWDFFQNVYGTQRHEDGSHNHKCIQSIETLSKMSEEGAGENPIYALAGVFLTYIIYCSNSVSTFIYRNYILALYV